MSNGTMTTAMLLSLVMGFSIFLSFPLTRKGNLKRSLSIFLVSGAIGILIFLIADVFSDVSSLIYPQNQYVSNIRLSFLFAISVLLIFILLYYLENSRISRVGNDAGKQTRIATIVAVGMGLQNLTEGLVFGSTYSIGLTGLILVILIGFVLQNFTEGFPIASPFLGNPKERSGLIALLYFIGGFPTVIGTLIGLFYFSSLFVVA
ncbi:MAG: hypothetical protein QXQ46_05955, partial [Thermoplasmatales archaeon]